MRALLASTQSPGIAAERALLGSLFINPAGWRIVRDCICADDFEQQENGVLYRSMAELYDRGFMPDVVAVFDALGGEVDAAGGPGYWASLAFEDVCPAPLHPEYYAAAVRKHARLRKLSEMGSEIVTEATKLGVDPSEIAARMARHLEMDDADGDEPQSIGDLVSRVYDEFEHGEAEQRGLPSGIRALDDLTNGFQPGDLVVLAARPSVGKTSLAITITSNAAVQTQRPVMVFSQEMTAEAVTRRLFGIEARIESGKLRTGHFSEMEWLRLSEAAARLAAAPIHIDSKPGLSVVGLRQRARRIHSIRPLALVAVDYIQLLTSGERRENRTQEVSAISHGLKALALELRIPVLALAQLSRKPVSDDTGKTREPVSADIRESGDVEQDADVILLMFRPYLPNGQEDPNRATVILDKQRNGPKGRVELMFNPELMEFRGMSREEVPF